MHTALQPPQHQGKVGPSRFKVWLSHFEPVATGKSLNSLASVSSSIPWSQRNSGRADARTKVDQGRQQLIWRDVLPLPAPSLLESWMLSHHPGFLQEAQGT